MNFPHFSFFYKVNLFYSRIRFSFLYNYYYKLHNILFTNLYIRIYRYKLIQLEKKKRKFVMKNKYQQVNRDLFLDKMKKKKSINKRRVNFAMEHTINRTYSSTFLHLESKPANKEWNFNKFKVRKKRPYVYINKFKDCGNQYNFDPFYLYSTYKLNDFNFYRTKKNKKKDIVEKQMNLSFFDNRLSTINFKYFNNYVFNLLLEIYKNPKTKKAAFLHALKNNITFFYNFLLFLKKRIMFIKFILNECKKTLRLYIYKLNVIFQFFNIDKDSISFFLSYIKKKKNSFFSLYTKLINSFISSKEKFDSFILLMNKYKKLYFSFFEGFKKKYDLLKKKKQQREKLTEHFNVVNKYEKIHNKIMSTISNSMHFLKLKSTTKWERKNIKQNVYVSVNKYISIFNSLFRLHYINNANNNNAIIYIKATATNVFLYFIYNNKLLFKKSCGELADIKKKERRFWRNVYPLVETILPFLVKMKLKYRFPFISLYLNGSDSLCTPLISRMRKYNKKFRRLVYFLFNEFEFFSEKTFPLKERFKASYVLYPIYRLKLYSIFDGFNRLSKIFFAINKIKDITSWPYNGCKHKKKKNVR